MSEESTEKAGQDAASPSAERTEKAPEPREIEARSTSAGAARAPAPEKGSEAQGRNSAWMLGIGAVCVVAALLVGRWWGAHDAQTARPGGGSLPVDPAAEELSAGLAATDPADAVAHFKKALDVNPTHYGATFQLARALDRAGRKDEAKAQWERVLRMAQQASDPPLVEAARARLGVPAGPSAAPPADPMLQGLDALYTKRDTVTAIARFRDVLAQNPDHYGATFQLATALDLVGDIKGSRPLWDKMAAMADAISDAKTAETARARMADIDKKLGPATPPDPEAEAMRAAVDALYVKKDAEAAIPLFRAILKRSPGHYGATFQLATALDQAKKPAEARPVWEKVLKLSEATADEKTASTARARLAQKP